jgi:hypothetical protein
VSTDNSLNFIELDVEDTDTYIINGSTAINSIVSHNAPCFVAGTQILLEDGTTKNIENVVIGENIVSFDLKNHEPKISKVLNIFSKKVEKIVEYEFLSGGKLKATLDHPIFVIDKGWCSYSSELSNLLYSLDAPIKAIELGDIVKLYESEDKIVKINIIEEPTNVYNLSEIETFHNYFANNVLVHNRCFVAGTKITLSDGTYKNIEEISVGESVLTFNEKLNITQIGTVGDVKSHTVNQLIEIIFEDDISITTTFEHPFYVKNNGYVEAKNLYVGCICIKDDMSELKIKEIIQKINVVGKEVTSIETKRDYTKASLLKIGTNKDTCPICLKTVTGEDKKHIEEKKELLSKEIEEFEAQIKNLDGKIGVYEDARQKLDQALRKLRDIINNQKLQTIIDYKDKIILSKDSIITLHKQKRSAWTCSSSAG